MDSYRGNEVFRQPGREDTVILLIRHAHTDALGVRLTGRAPGVALSAIGRAQLPALQRALGSHTLSAIYSSPLERALATARAVADAQRLPVRAHEGLTEVDFGDWTGKTFDELARLDEWREFNTRRATAVVPAGESASTVQTRIVTTLQALGCTHRGETIAAVSHADVIRAAVLHYAGVSLDEFSRFEIPPASVSALALRGARGTLLSACDAGGAAGRCG